MDDIVECSEMCVADSEGFGSESELPSGKSNGQWQESSTSVLCTGLAGR